MSNITTSGTSSTSVRVASRVCALAGLAAMTLLVGCNNAGQGALTGAAAGAGAGAIIGSLTGSAGKGAIIGGAAGALGGAVLGDQNERNSRNTARNWDR
jgi:hypothetical protein